MTHKVELVQIRRVDHLHYDATLRIDGGREAVLPVAFRNDAENGIEIDDSYERIFGHDYSYVRNLYALIREIHQGRLVELPMRISGMFDR